MSLRLTSAETLCRVFDVQRFSIHDGPGIRTTVFLEGCPLRCGWCQNPEGLRNGHAPARTAASVIAEVLEDSDYYRISGGGITLSGGEPLLHLEPARALLDEAKRHGLHTCVQTSGAIATVHLEAVQDVVDLFQFDLKHLDAERHRALTGVGNERILENAAWLAAHSVNVQFRMPVLPEINDDPANVDAVAGFVRRLGVGSMRLVPYHGMYVQKYEALGLVPRICGIPIPSDDSLRALAERFEARGIRTEIDA